MNDLIKTGKQVFTFAVVLSTIAWSVGLGALALPLAANAVTLASGDLIKGSGTAVYYYGNDEKRYVFPYAASYNSWYTGFGTVKTLSDAELIAIPFGGNVTARPARLAQVVSMDTPWTVMDSKVYAVEKGGVLRWVKTATVASEIFGATWESQIVAIPESLLTNYTIGSEINAAGDYTLATQQAVVSVNEDKGLVGGGTGAAGTLAIALASDTPVAASIPKAAADVNFTKVNLTAGSSDVSVTGLKVTRTGLGVDSNLNALKLYVDGVQRGTSQTLGSTHMATFTLTTNPIAVPANSTVAVVLGADIIAAPTYDQHILGIANATDVTTTATVTGSFPVNGNVMSLANVAIGTVTITGGTLNPGTAGGGDIGVDPAAEGFRFSQAKFLAGATEAIVVEQLTLIKNGTASNSDVKNIVLYNDTAGTTLGTVAALNSDGKAVFKDLNLAIAKGGYAELSVKADMAGGSGRTIGFDLHDGTSFSGKVKGSTYNSGIAPTIAAAFCDTGVTAYTCQTQTINQGYLTVSKSSSAPATGKIAVGASGVPLMAFDFTVAGEPINVSSSVVKYTTTVATADQFTNWTLYKADGSILAGPKNGDDTDVGEEILTFTDAYTLPIGTTVVYVKADVASDTAALDTVYVHTAAGAITAKGANSGKTVYTTSTDSTVPPAAVITGNTMTVSGPTIVIKTAATPVASTIVVNAQDQTLAYFDLDATAGGEDVRVSAITVTGTDDDDGTDPYADLNNFELWGDPDNTDATAQNIRLETSNSTVLLTDVGGATPKLVTMSFTFRTPLIVSKTAASRLTLKADVVGNTGTITAFNVNAGGDYTAVGKSSGVTATKTVNGAGQNRTVAAKGTLKVEKAADMASAVQIASSTTGLEVMKYKFTSAYEAIDVTEFGIFCGNNSQTGTACTTANVSKVYVYADGALIGSTSGYSLNATGTASVVLPSGTLVIPQDGTKYVSIKIDVPEKAQVTPTATALVQIGLSVTVDASATDADDSDNADSEDNMWGDSASVDNDYKIVATGSSSGAVIPQTTINSLGTTVASQVFGSNGMSIHKGVLTVSLDASTPVEVQSPGTDKEVLRFNLTATGDDVELNALEMCLSGTATNNTNTPTGTLSLKSPDKSTTYGDITMTLTTDYDAYWTAVVGAADYYFTADGTTGTKCVSFGDNEVGDYAVANTAGSAMEAFNLIPAVTAGTTKTLSLFMDTTGIAVNETLQVIIGPNSNTDYDVATASGIDWEDSSDTNINLSTTKNLPLVGAALRY